ncbi:MAG: hypothetical protein Q9220_006427 [cf. Caloplaca sp. 1 TL-2023]
MRVQRRFLTTNPRLLDTVVEQSGSEAPSSPPRRKWLWLSGMGLLGSSIWLGYTGVLGAWLGFDVGTEAAQANIFQDYELLKMQRISSTSYVFKCQPATFGATAYKSRLDGNSIMEASQKGIWSVQIKHPLLNIARLYTPVPFFISDPDGPALGGPKENFHSVDPEENQLRFLIRNNPEGELSRFLSRLQPGARLELRGPYQEYKIPDGLEHVVFLAGGTGIAPALQMVHTLLENRTDEIKPKIDILWANRRTEDCQGALIESSSSSESFFRRVLPSMFGQSSPKSSPPTTPALETSPLVKDLSALQARHKGLLEVTYFADDQQRFISEQDVRSKLRIPNADTREASQKAAGRKLILISGPDGFIEHFAGSKVWQEGRELQGELGGLLNKIQLPGWTVWKL